MKVESFAKFISIVMLFIMSMTLFHPISEEGFTNNKILRLSSAIISLLASITAIVVFYL